MNKIAELCLFAELCLKLQSYVCLFICFVLFPITTVSKTVGNKCWVILHINKMKRIFRSPARPLCSRHRHLAIIESFPRSFVSALALPVA